MKKAQPGIVEQPRFRSGSVSDMHIQYCDCSHCDGTGELLDPFLLTGSECPACEGMGYLEPTSREAYEAYLNDLYSDVIRPMPAHQPGVAVIYQSPSRAAKQAEQKYYPAA